MGVRSIPYTFFSCDFPNCKKELISENKFDEAVKEARKLGWSYSDSYRPPNFTKVVKQVRCPEHRWKNAYKRRKLNNTNSNASNTTKE